MTDLLARVCREGSPLLDAGAAVFVWQGAQPPILRGDWNDWDEQNGLAWQRQRGPRGAATLWTATLPLADDAYIEYCLGSDAERITDPLNPRRVTNGMGKYNHWFRMPASAPTPWMTLPRGLPRGVITRHRPQTDGLVAGSTREVTLYQPPCTQPAPLLVVYDGPDYLYRGRITAILDHLAARGRVQAPALALLAHGRSARMAEYGGSDGTLLFVQHVVLPLAQAHLNLVDAAEQPGRYGVMGASMGGLMALVTALRLPQLFGRVLSQSGAFAYGAFPAAATGLLSAAPSSALPQVWMDVGRYEALLDCNRVLRAELQARGSTVHYREYSAGHNYPAWRDELADGLMALFPPLAD